MRFHTFSSLAHTRRETVLAYKIPRARTPLTASLTFQLSCTDHNMGTGSRANTRSVRRETLELKKAANLRSLAWIHLPPGIEWSQMNFSGVHWKNTVT